MKIINYILLGEKKGEHSKRERANKIQYKKLNNKKTAKVLVHLTWFVRVTTYYEVLENLCQNIEKEVPNKLLLK